MFLRYLSSNFFLSFILMASLVACSFDDEVKRYDSGTSFYDQIKSDDFSEGEAKQFVLDFLSKLPKSSANSYWPSESYVPGENLKVASDFNDYQSISVGSEPKTGLNISSPPIVAENKIFTIDGKGIIQARDLNNPKKLIWQIDPEKQYRDEGMYRSITNFFYDSDDFLGGNISYSLGKIFLTTKRGNVAAFYSDTGEKIWFKKIGVPIRSAPVAQDGNLIFTTIDNKTYNLNSKNGDKKWLHDGYEEKSKLYSSPSALIINDNVLVTYSSGEVFLLSLNSGGVKWTSIISPNITTTLNPSVNDIHKTPTIHKGIVYFVAGDGSLMAIDYDNGDILWTLQGQNLDKRPWAVSEFLFTGDRRGNLVAVAAKTGRVVWKSKLQTAEAIEDDNLKFTDPVLVNGKIMVADNDGYLRAYSTDNGAILFETSISSSVHLRPTIANEKLLLLSNEANLNIFN
jgi:outer membrane protein assembly factor BamB